MPRKPKPLTPGYANRTDKLLPQSAVPGQQYGQATQQLQSQRVVPMAGAPAAPSPVQAAQNLQSAGSPPTNPQPGPATAAGMFPPLDGPTARPMEPVTAGAATGPGPGPESLPIPPTPTRLSQTIAQLAQSSGNTDLFSLAAHAQAAGQ